MTKPPPVQPARLVYENSANACAEAIPPSNGMLIEQLSWAAEMCGILGWRKAQRYILFVSRELEEGDFKSSKYD